MISSDVDGAKTLNLVSMLLLVFVLVLCYTLALTVECTDIVILASMKDVFGVLAVNVVLLVIPTTV